MTTLKEYEGILQPEIMTRYPSGTAAPTFPAWVANHAGLEQCLGVAGLLDAAFYEVGGLVLYDRDVAEKLVHVRPTTPFGDDRRTVERYFNVINLAEFFLMSADDAVHRADLVQAFGSVLQHFWGVALKLRFPERRFMFEVAEDLFAEEGLCFTFSQD